MVDKHDKKVENDRLSPDLNRRQFLKGIGLIGVGGGTALADHVLRSNEPGQAAQTDLVPTSSTIPLQGESDSLISQTSSGEIPRRPLGRTGVQVSAIGLGGATLGQAKSMEEAIRITQLFKTSMRFDGPIGREQHGFPTQEQVQA